MTTNKGKPGKTIAKNVVKLRGEGYREDQAVAIAKRKAGKAKPFPPKKGKT